MLQAKQITLHVKRDDLRHPILSGNKWLKLKHLLLEIENRGYNSVAAMGGRYSNFLHALGYTCHLLGWQSRFFIRGHPEQNLTPMLKDLKLWGAELVYVNREKFRQIRQQPPDLNNKTFWFAEGGHHLLAIKGIAESLMELNHSYDYLILATATGTSLAGYLYGINHLALSSRVVGIAVLNNAQAIKRNVEKIIEQAKIPANQNMFELITGYEFGGYAKKNQQLTDFMMDFQIRQRIPLEFVYSGKSFFATMDLIAKNYFPQNSSILLIHCGGLQALRD